MEYGSYRTKDNVTAAAFKGFRTSRGDCYVYYAMCEVMMTRAGIENIPIKRIPGTRTVHYWSLVNVGEGWYHFDAYPRKISDNAYYFGDLEAEAVTRRNPDLLYYLYDKSLYPEVEP
jgi:hypothetical protein